MKRIAVLARGGDAPGMNSVIRAIVRAGADRGLGVYGVRHGFNGPIIGDMRRLGPRDVGGSMQPPRLFWPDHQQCVFLRGVPGSPRMEVHPPRWVQIVFLPDGRETDDHSS